MFRQRALYSSFPMGYLSLFGKLDDALFILIKFCLIKLSYSDWDIRSLLFSGVYICITCTFTWSQSCSKGVAVHRFLAGYNQRRTQSSHICAQVKRIQNGLQEFLEKCSPYGHQLHPI